MLLELPADVAAAEFDEASFAYTPARSYRSAGDPADVAAAAKALLEARRPVLHVGHGVLWAEAWDELRELAELVQAPVMTTMAGKSAFPEDHPLSIGAGGHTLSKTGAQFLVQSDLVFGIGCSFAKGSFSTPIPGGKRMVQLTHDAENIDREYPVELAVVGDAKLVLRQLIDYIGSRQNGRAAREGVADEIKSARAAELDAWLPRLTSENTPINPYRVLWELVQRLDRRKAIVTHDSGNPRDQTLTSYEALVPRGYLGWGKSTQLGTGLGVALGAKLAFPDYQVVNVMGDLAFGTAGMEVETAVRERLPIMTVILNNGRMGGYDHHMPTASERYGSNLLTGDYARVAAGLGAHAERVEQPADVDPPSTARSRPRPKASPRCWRCSPPRRRTTQRPPPCCAPSRRTSSSAPVAATSRRPGGSRRRVWSTPRRCGGRRGGWTTTGRGSGRRAGRAWSAR